MISAELKENNIFSGKLKTEVWKITIENSRGL